jgi:hypothetical protein
MSWTIERRGRVAVVTMTTNPVNAQNRAFFADLHQAFDRLERDHPESPVVLTGTGTPTLSQMHRQARRVGSARIRLPPSPGAHLLSRSARTAAGKMGGEVEEGGAAVRLGIDAEGPEPVAERGRVMGRVAVDAGGTDLPGCREPPC